MTYQKEARTAFANRAVVVGELFNVKFRATRFKGAVTRIVRVEPPNTESTGGGKMARESITLVPESAAAEGNAIVVGYIDVGASKAEVRAYSLLADRHRQRFGNLPFDLDKGEYDAFVAEAQKFLSEEMIEVTVVEDAPDRTASQPSMPAIGASSGSTNPGMRQTVGPVMGTATASSSGGASMTMLLIGIIIGVAIGGVVVLLFAR